MKMYKKTIFSTITALGMIAATLSCLPAMTASATTTCGDTNDDGSVTMSDVVLANRYLSGIVNSDDVNLKNMDVDRNTVLDVDDSKILLKYMVSSITSLPYSESGNTFDYSSYAVPADSTRAYVKYNCSTGTTSSYTLTSASSISTLSGDTDDRVIDSSSNAQCIVYLTFDESDGSTYRGSGFIVDDHTIATCAHCLYDGTAFNTNYTISIYDTDGTSIVASYSPSELHVPQSYIDSNYPGSSYNGTYDYGLIYVSSDLSAYGNMSLGTVTNNFRLTGQTVNISGYPASVNGTYTNSRYYGSGTVKTTNSYYKIYSYAYNSGGDSGGPTYIEYTLNGQTFRSAIGINAAVNDAVSPRYSVSTRITTPILRFFMNNSYIGS